MSEEDKINLFVRNKRAYIWTSNDWKKMRLNRVVGNFVGNLAALPRQDFHQGLPLALLPEEATLLAEKGFAHFKEVPTLSQKPSDELREKFQHFRNEIFSEQIELFKNSRKREIEKNIKQIVKGKKSKKQSQSSQNEISEIEEEELERQILQEEFNKIQDPKQSSLLVQIFVGDPWIALEDCKEYNWEYPQTEDEKLHYLTYKDLWEQGYYVTSGKKFGADYLVYPAEPFKFHSFFIVVCVDKKRELHPAEIIAYGRLGQSVRKTFVLAYLSDGKVKYQSFQWAGR